MPDPRAQPGSGGTAPTRPDPTRRPAPPDPADGDRTQPAAEEPAAGGRQAAARGVRPLFAHPAFGRLLAVRLSGQWADGVFQASLAGAVLFNPERAATPGDIAAAFAVLLLPYSLLGPVAGVLLDRWRRQRVLVVANLARVGLVSGVAALVWSGVGGTPLYAAALVVVSLSRFVLSTLSAALPRVTSPARLVPANAFTTTAGTVAAAIGGACGIAVGALGGAGDREYGEVAALAAVGYLLAALLAAGLSARQLGPDRTVVGRRAVPMPSPAPDAAAARTRTGVGWSAWRDLGSGLLAGVRHLAARPPARNALIVIGTHRFVFGLATVATVLLYRGEFTGSTLFPAGLGGLTQVVLAAAGGSLLAAAVSPRGVRAWGARRWIVGLLLLAGLGQLVLGLPFWTETTVPAAAVLGFAGQGVKVCVDSILQRTVDDDFRGRTFTVYDTLFNVAFVGAAVTAALTLPPSGRSVPMLLVVVAGYLLAALWYARATGVGTDSPSEATHRSRHAS